MKEWAFGWECCVDCGTRDRKHHGNGLCNRCYGRKRWQTNPKLQEQTRAAARRNYQSRRVFPSHAKQAEYRKNSRTNHAERFGSPRCIYRKGTFVTLRDGRKGVCVDRCFRLSARVGEGARYGVLVAIDGAHEVIRTSEVTYKSNRRPE